MIRNDDWRTMTEPLLGGDKLWVGYTFFQEIPQGTVSGRLPSGLSSSASKEQRSQTPSSGASATLARGRDAMSRGLTLGYENRLRGQGERGERQVMPSGMTGDALWMIW